MNILKLVETTYYPNLARFHAKAFFNKLITERKGDIPEFFFSP